jgi:hypothetical protein
MNYEFIDRIKIIILRHKTEYFTRRNVIKVRKLLL